MIVCCYFCARYPLKYSLLWRRKGEKEDRVSKADRIASFWKHRMIGPEFTCLLDAAKMENHDLLKHRMHYYNFGAIQFEKDQQVQVWWLGGCWEGRQLPPDWYDATVLSANGDGSYTVKYDGDKSTVVITHRTRVLTSYLPYACTRTLPYTHIPTSGSLTGNNIQS